MKLKIQSLATAHPVLLAITAAVVAIGATVAVVDLVTTSFDELQDKISELNDELSESKSVLDDYTSQLSEVEQKINEINSLDTLSFTDEEELNRLQAQKSELETLYNIEKARYDLKQKEIEDAAKEYFNKNVLYSKVGTSTLTYEDSNGELKTVENNKTYSSIETNKAEQVKHAIDNAIYFQNLLNELTEEFSKLENPTQEDRDNYTGKRNSYESIIERHKKEALDIQEENEKIVDGLDVTSEYYKIVRDAGEYLNAGLGRLAGEKTTSEIFSDNMKKFGLTDDNISYLLDALSEEELEKVLSTNKLDLKAGLKLYFDDGQLTETELRQILQKIQNELNEKELKLKVAWDDPSKIFEESENKLSTPTLVDLESEASALAAFKKELDSGKKNVSISALKSVFEEYPEALKAVSDYEQRLLTQEELFEKLKGFYEDDVDAYIGYLAEESKADSEFWTAVYNNSVEIQELLGDMYDGDVANFETATEAKELVYKRSMNKLKAEYADYLKFVVEGEDGLLRQATQEDILDGRGEWESSSATDLGEWDEYRNSPAYKAIDDMLAQINKENQLIDKEIDEFLRRNRDYSYDVLGDGSGSGSSSDKNNFDWIERVLNRISNAYTKLKNVVSDTTQTWATRNQALVESMKPLEEEIKAQDKAYEAYMAKANNINLSEDIKKLVRDGAYRIDDAGTYDEATEDKINEYKEWYDKAIDAQIAADEATRNWRSAAKEKFDGIKSDFDLQLGLLEDASNALSKEQDILEENGYMASTYLYDALAKQEEANIELLKKERDTLIDNLNKAVASGQVVVESEDWYAMKTDINAVSSTIQDATLSLAQYNNELRQVKWDAFDKTREKVQQLVDESDFLYGLLEDEGLIDDETGVLNEYGNAAQALIAQKYNAYMNQADQYADAIAEIDKKILETPTDSKLVERKQELVEAQRDAINAAIAEKNAIKDLTSEAYDAYLSNLNDVIDKYKELMQTMKNAYDYEKQMSEKTENLTKLQKQYMAYQNDDSEVGMKMRQELGVKIEEAQEDIEQTEYEKMISDTEKLLDELSTETEAWIDERLENIDQTIEGVIQATNDNANVISDTLREVASSVGVDLSKEMQSVWNNKDGQNVLTNYTGDFTNQSTSLNEAVDSIAKGVQAMLEAANLKVKDSTPNYSTGTLHAKTRNGWAWTNEDGSELIRTSDGAILTRVGEGGTVFNSDMTNKLWEFANNPANFLSGLGLANVNVPEVKSSNTQNIDVGGFNIQVIANNPEEFAQQMKKVMANDKNAQKMIQEITLGQPFGNNSLNVHKYK